MARHSRKTTPYKAKVPATEATLTRLSAVPLMMTLNSDMQKVFTATATPRVEAECSSESMSKNMVPGPAWCTYKHTQGERAGREHGTKLSV